MNSKLKGEGLDRLFSGILALESVDECYMLFDDLCTVSELRAMEQRFHVAEMLRGGRVYSDIATETGASSATISRVSRCLNYGSEGYTLVLDRLAEDKDNGV